MEFIFLQFSDNPLLMVSWAAFPMPFMMLPKKLMEVPFLSVGGFKYEAQQR